jgi:hypothetical protein
MNENDENDEIVTLLEPCARLETIFRYISAGFCAIYAYCYRLDRSKRGEDAHSVIRTQIHLGSVERTWGKASDPRRCTYELGGGYGHA